MRLILVTGFLGTGKTTLIIRLARAAIDRGLRTAIVVNEAGEIGIDDQLMRHLGLNVRELANGCICCTLAAELPATLQRLAAESRPDLVIVEPSGIAEPGSILAALALCRDSPVEQVSVGCVVDPLRLAMLLEVVEPLINRQISAAAWVVISKIDQAAAEEMAVARRIVTELNPGAQRFELCGKAPLPAEFLRELLPAGAGS
jgi:G3E family GTPase